MEELTQTQKDLIDGLNKSMADLKAKVEANEALTDKTEANKAELETLKEALEAAKAELEATKNASQAQGEKINEMAADKGSQVRIGSYADQIRKQIQRK